MRKLALFILLIFSFVCNAQQTSEIKIKKILELEKSFVFKFKNLKTKKIDYIFSYKKDVCKEGIEIKKNKKYNLALSEINISHQNDDNEYLMGVDNFNIPKNHKLYYSDHIKGTYMCE